MGWRNAFDNAKPVFVTIYATVIIGIIFSSLYVISAIYSGKSAADSTTSWLSHVGSPPVEQAPNVSEPAIVQAVPTPSLEPRSMSTRPIWEAPLHTKKMPALKKFRLSKELVQERVKDNVIIVTFGNYAFMDFILTWVKRLTDLGLSNVLIGAMDTKLLEALYWKGVPVFDMGSHMSTIDVGWGSPTFHKMGREKVILIDSVLPYGYELLMCDTDMVWLKDPLPYLARYPEADVLTSSDQVVPTVTDDRLDIWQQVGAAYNIGIFHWRPTDAAKRLAKEWKDMLLADEKIWDQNGFNDLVRKQLGPPVDGESGLVYAFDGNLKLGVLPASIFCSGHTYFVQAMYQQLRLEPYAVHTTFQYAGTEGKRHRLREGMVFYDPPEYYDAPGGFLSFKPSIPKSLLLDGEHNVKSHFSLINYQIKQIRMALAISSLLNRTLVMPPLWCRLDRLWFPHPGVLEGSITRQPFICPLDHVFEVDIHWDKFLLKQPLYLNSRISVTFSTSRQLTDKFMDFAFQRSSKWVRKISLRYIEHASLQFATPSLRLRLCDSTSPSFNIDSSSSNLDAAADNFYRPDLKKAALARVSVGHRSLKVSKSGVKKRNRQVVKTPGSCFIMSLFTIIQDPSISQNR